MKDSQYPMECAQWVFVIKCRKCESEDVDEYVKGVSKCHGCGYTNYTEAFKVERREEAGRRGIVVGAA